MMFGRVLATSQASPPSRVPTTASCIVARTMPRTREATVPAAIPAVERARSPPLLPLPRLVSGASCVGLSTNSVIEGGLLHGGAGGAGGPATQRASTAEHQDDPGQNAQNPEDPGARGLHAHVDTGFLSQQRPVGRGQDGVDGDQ